MRALSLGRIPLVPFSLRRIRTCGITVAVVVGGVLLSIEFARRSTIEQRRRAEERFQVDARAAEERVLNHLAAYESVVLSAAGLFAASEEVNRAEWAHFVALSGVLERVPGVLGLGFIERTPLDETEAFLEEVRGEGLAVEQVFEYPGSDRGPVDEPRYLIRLHAPVENEVKIGADMSRRSDIKPVLDEAMRQGEARLVASIELALTDGRPVGAVLIQPVYRSDLATRTPAEREAALQGWIGSPVHFQRSIEESTIIDPARLRIEIEATTAQGTALLASSLDAEHSSSFRRISHQPFAGLELDLRIEAADDAIFAAPPTAIPVALVGLALTGMLAAATSQVLRALGRVRQASSTFQRQIAPFTAAVESAPNPTLLIDLDGRIQFANGRAREVAAYLGRSSESGLEHMAFQLDPSFRDRMLDSVLRGETLVESVRLESAATLGSERALWLEVTASPVHDEEGQVLCILWTERDVTEIVQRGELAKARAEVAAAWARASTLLTESGALEQRLEAALQEVIQLEGVGLGDAAAIRTVEVCDSSKSIALELGTGDRDGARARAFEAAQEPTSEVRVEWLDASEQPTWVLHLAHDGDGLGAVVIAGDDRSRSPAELSEPLVELAMLLSRTIARHYRAEHQRTIDAELERLHHRLTTATSGSGVGIWELDPATMQGQWDHTLSRMHGLEPGHTPSFDEWLEMVHPEDRAEVLAAFQGGFESGERFTQGFRITLPSRGVRYVKTSASFLCDSEGVVRLAVGACWDTSDTEGALEQLRESQRVARVGSWSFDVRTEQVSWSEQLFSLFSRNPEDGPPTFEQILHEDYDEESAARLAASVERAMATGEGYALLLRRRDDSDGIRWLKAEGRARQGYGGEVVELYGTVFDVTEMVERELSLREITAALDASSEAVFMFDADSLEFVYSNQCAREKLGWEIATLRGESPEDLVDAEHREGLAMMLAELRRDPSQTLVTRTQLRRRTGGGLPVEVALQLLPDLGPSGRFLAICRDITHQLEAEAELKCTVEEANAANRAKGDFLANMSHEIRTPMTAILGFTDLLVEGVTGDAPKEDLESSARTIQASARHLLALVNDILDMSKIESGQLHLESIDCELAEVVEGVRSVLAPIAADKGVALRLNWEGPVPRTIRTDPTRLRQVLYNLTGNAVKFTAEGSVTISVAFEAAEGQLRFAVEDTGIGMTAAQLRAVRRFEAFSQADASTTRRFGGTGLGLRISNALTLALGGSFELDSTAGVGTRSVFTLPVPEAMGRDLIDPSQAHPEAERTRPAAAKPAKGATRPLEGLQVLVVEDGLDNQKLIKIHLRRAGAQVEFANNGVECLERMQDTSVAPPDLILMDMQMPELDGYGATRELRKRGCKLPIIAVTANVMTGDRERCIEAGCDDFVAKPIDHVVMVETCARWGTPGHDDSLVA
ncbi:MAG: ATP-binding protein [Planctomycetota bacterium]